MSDKWARARFILRQNPTAHLDHDQSLELLDERDELEKSDQAFIQFTIQQGLQLDRQLRAIEALQMGIKIARSRLIQDDLANATQPLRHYVECAERILKGEE